MLAILLYLGGNLKRTTRLKSYFKVRMNLFSKSCFPTSWISTSFIVVPSWGRWFSSLQITKVRLWVVTLLELNQRILLLQIINYNFKGFLKLLFFNAFSNWFGLHGLLVLNATFSRTLFLVVIIVNTMFAEDLFFFGLPSTTKWIPLSLNIAWVVALLGNHKS